MKYPFNKQINKVYNLEQYSNLATKIRVFSIQALIIFFKVLLTIIIGLAILYFIQSLQIKILYKNLNDQNLSAYYSNVKNQILEIQNNWNAMYEEIVTTGIMSSIVSWLNSFLNSTFNSVIEALNVLISTPTEPITSGTIGSYLSAADTFYSLGVTCDIAALALSAIPFGIDFETPLSIISEELFTLGDFVLNKYNTTILPIIEKTNSQWQSTVLPLTTTINSCIVLTSSFISVTFFLPILIGNESGLFGLPIYFWLAFAVSIILTFIMLFYSLVKISSTSSQGEKNKGAKNFVFGLMLTLLSFIIIPIIFAVVMTFFILIIESIFSVSMLNGSSLSSQSISELFVSNSVKNGAIFLGDFNHPYGYLDGNIILLTNNYFDYTFFTIFSIVVIILLFVLMIIIIIKVFTMIHYLLIGPIVMVMYMRDGMIMFSTWSRNVVKLFFEIMIITLQLVLMLELCNLFNSTINEILSYNPESMIIMFTILFASTIIGIFVFSTNITNLFFKDNRVKAELEKNSFDDVKIDTNITNKNLKVRDEGLSKTVRKGNLKSNSHNKKNLQQISKNLDNLNKAIEEQTARGKNNNG